jgi:hypothetical protein
MEGQSPAMIAGRFDPSRITKSPKPSHPRGDATVDQILTDRRRLIAIDIPQSADQPRCDVGADLDTHTHELFQVNDSQDDDLSLALRLFNPASSHVSHYKMRTTTHLKRPVLSFTRSSTRSANSRLTEMNDARSSTPASRA